MRKVSYCQLELDDAPRVVPDVTNSLPEQDDSRSGSNIEFDPYAREALPLAAAFIDEALRCDSDDLGGPVVYAHCAGGISRSCCAVLAYLVSRRRLRLCDAYAQIKAARPIVGTARVA